VLGASAVDFALRFGDGPEPPSTSQLILCAVLRSYPGGEGFQVRTDLSGEAADPQSALAPLRVPIFRAVWIASLFSNFGSLIQSVGASWMMISIAPSADMVALVQTSVTLPLMLLSLVAGAMADNLDRRTVMLGSQVFMLVMSFVLSACAWTGVLTPWLLLSFTFLIGCGGAFNNPAWQASVGDMVPRSQLPGAVALNGVGFNMARSVGPAIGGIIVASAGPAVAFAVNAASKIGLVGVLARWRPPPDPRILPRETLGVAVAAGLRYVWLSPAIRTVLIRGAVFGFGSSAVLALMPIVAQQLLGGGPLTYGLLSGAFGIGAVGGGISNAWLRQQFSTEAIVRAASVGCAIAAAVFGFGRYLPLAMLVLIVAGVAWVVALSTFNVAVQLATPRWVVARALSIYQTATFGGMAIGSWVLGELTEHKGIGAGLLTAACFLLLNAVLGRWLPLSQIEQLNLDPFRPLHEPATVVPVDSRTGPVVISVEYRISDQDIVEFLTLMEERRRIRRRDGARNWTLLRDLADREIWIERYKSATWLDYLRHNSRMTHDDASVFQRLRALHRGPETPVVRRLLERQTGSPPLGQTTAPSFSEPVTDPTRST
jgi:MFS family permease